MDSQNNNTLLDGKVLACNFAEGTSECRQGAIAYVHNNNPGWGGDRMEVLVRSRSGRWILKWESVHRLCNFRFKTIPPANPKYSTERMGECMELGDRLVGYGADQADAYNRVAEEGRMKQAA